MPVLILSRIAESYAVLFLIAWSKIVGFEVRPVTDNSSMYRARVPLSSRSRVMLSSQMLCPRLWSACVAFIVVQPPELSRLFGFQTPPNGSSILLNREAVQKPRRTAY